MYPPAHLRLRLVISVVFSFQVLLPLSASVEVAWREDHVLNCGWARYSEHCAGKKLF